MRTMGRDVQGDLQRETMLPSRRPITFCHGWLVALFVVLGVAILLGATVEV